MSIIMNTEQLKLPESIAEKIKGNRIELIETDEGILIRPIQCNPIKELRGFLKGSKFTTENYLKQKQQEKELDWIR